MGAHYELRGSVYPRVTEILNAYPDDDKSTKLKEWAAMLALRDLAQKLAHWSEEDAGRHIHELMRFFDEKDKPAKQRDKTLVEQWSPVVNAHKEAHREVLRFLGDAGTKAHVFIEEALKISMGLTGEVVEGVDGLHVPKTPDDIDLLTEYALRAAANWGRWFEARARPGGFKPVALETKLISPSLGYGGTSDCVAEFKGGLWVFDWKSSSRIDRIRHAMQGVAYLALLEEEAVWCFEGGKHIKAKRDLAPEDLALCEAIRIDGIAIVRVDRLETAFEHYEVPSARIGPLWEMFKKLLETVEHKAAFERAIRGLK